MAETSTIHVWDDENDNVGAEGHHDPAVFLAAVREYHLNDCGFDTAEITRLGYDFTPDRVEHVWLKDADDPNDDRMFEVAPDDPGAIPHTLIRG